MSERTCVECGVPVPGRGRRLYCSPQCALVELSCRSCGETFMCERKRLHRNPVCSLSCRKGRQWGQPMVDVECGHCGTPLRRYQSQLDGGRGKFCSRSCAGLARPINGRPSQIATDATALFSSACSAPVVAELRVAQWSIDVALPDQMIAIELDGEYWHSIPAMRDRDRRKDESLIALGWTVIRIPIRKGDTASDIADRMTKELSQCLTLTP
jgi:hypothetical protein